MEYQDMIEKEIATHARMIQGGPMEKMASEWGVRSMPVQAFIFAMNKILIREIGTLRQQVADLQEVIHQDADK